ncbi:isoaspartyl peptidase/L-asparaginase [Shewanella maritima]|uniref:Isoaspartyl peptidase n=2 Tax=Shewanella maritima TaxID=2520507 RepID=A0A411PLE1_9GAMM|nr:isoaspartyl peptidase/L-asparaginase [Shewanella maritima]
MKKLIFTLALTGMVFSPQLLATDAKPYAIAIHGGAGTIKPSSMTDEQQKAYRAKLKQAVDAGYDILEQGGTSLDAVKTAINVLENTPYFNAGVGSVYTFDGGHELDASIMDGKTMNAGAVSGVKHIKNPIDLAISVMHKSPHVMLYGQGAEEFALTQGYQFVPNTHFDTPHRYAQLLDAKQKIMQREQKNGDYQASVNSLKDEYKFGTVGAVALDKSGNLVAGTSTGGMTAKRFNRIGDSPVIGAGTYAENGVCAVSATGHGEYFIRYQVAGDICAKVKYQQKPIAKAADEVINQTLVEAGGTGGVITVDHKGNIAMPFNTGGMYRASRAHGEQAKVMIWKDK